MIVAAGASAGLLEALDELRHPAHRVVIADEYFSAQSGWQRLQKFSQTTSLRELDKVLNKNAASVATFGAICHTLEQSQNTTFLPGSLSVRYHDTSNSFRINEKLAEQLNMVQSVKVSGNAVLLGSS